ILLSYVGLARPWNSAKLGHGGAASAPAASAKYHLIVSRWQAATSVRLTGRLDEHAVGVLISIEPASWLGCGIDRVVRGGRSRTGLSRRGAVHSRSEVGCLSRGRRTPHGTCPIAANHDCRTY